jgi:hypothetical protein
MFLSPTLIPFLNQKTFLELCLMAGNRFLSQAIGDMCETNKYLKWSKQIKVLKIHCWMHLLHLKALGANFVILGSRFIIHQEFLLFVVNTSNELIQMSSPKLTIPFDEKNNKIVKCKVFFIKRIQSTPYG